MKGRAPVVIARAACARGLAASVLWWSLALTLAGSLAPREARAEVARYAVIVGNNVGAAREGTLRFAENDARKVQAVLQQLGGFRPENTVLLQGGTVGEVQRVLISLNARIRSENSAARDAMLVVYYSGHADARGLHLGREILDLDLLTRLVQGSAAAFRMLVVDACRSGTLTRVKGAQPIAPFPINERDELPGEGVAFLTSSAADEDAQESEELQGSFFTHYFVSGLRGAADKNRNGTVSVEEVYDYAYFHTLEASSRTAFGLQHPTFHFDLKGKGGTPLTWVDRRASGIGLLAVPRGKDYLIFSGSVNGPVVAEVAATDARREIALPAGSYFVRGRAPDHLLEGVVHLPANGLLFVPEDELHRVQYARLARKGLDTITVAHGPWIAGHVRSPLWDGATHCFGARIGYLWDLPSFSLSIGAGGCRSTFSNRVVLATADELGAQVETRYVVDTALLSLGLGVAAGASWLRQDFDTQGVAPSRDSIAGRVGPVVSLSGELFGGLYWIVSGQGELYWFRQQRSGNIGRATSEGLAAVVSWGATAGLGKYF